MIEHIKNRHITQRWKAMSTSAVAGKPSQHITLEVESLEHFSSCWQAQSAHHPEVESYCPDRYRHNILLQIRKDSWISDFSSL